MIIHYIGQWLFIKLVDAPVRSITWKWYEIEMEYAYWKMQQQFGVVVMGPASNTGLFLFLVITCHLSQKFIGCFPIGMCKFIAWYGIATCLDFFLIVVLLARLVPCDVARRVGRHIRGIRSVCGVCHVAM